MFNSKSPIVPFFTLSLFGAVLVSCNNIRIPSFGNSKARRADEQAQMQSGLARGVEVQDGYRVGDSEVQVQTQQGLGWGALHQKQEQKHGDKYQVQEQDGGVAGTQMQFGVKHKNKTYVIQEQEMVGKKQLKQFQKMTDLLPL